MGAGASQIAQGAPQPGEGGRGGRVARLSLSTVATSSKFEADPWYALKNEEVLERIKGEEWQLLCVEAVEEFKESLSKVDKNSVALTVQAEDIDIDEAYLQEMVFHAKLLGPGGQIMGLSLTNNELTTASALDVPNQIRQLNLGGNPFIGVPSLLGCKLLVDLNLSYIEGLMTTTHGAPFAHLQALLRLDLTCTGLSRLFSEDEATPVLGGLDMLQELSLAENELVDTEEVINAINPLRCLTELDLQNNPCCDDVAYKQGALVAECPWLQRLDGSSTKMKSDVQGSLGTELGPLGSLEKEDHRNSLKIGDAPSMAQMSAMEQEVGESPA
mmetsp:Transcript_77894/g.223648  ORF Transcript_77894/g.223648 Transcript_77894/m.223648 type:complete len:329 (+) Transcript_77894:202-1188(+)